MVVVTLLMLMNYNINNQGKNYNRDNKSENKDEDEDRITLMTFMSEEDWRNIGIQGTPGWYHFRKGKNF